MTSTHTHTVAAEKDFANTKHGAIETCECGATRLLLPSEFGIVRTGWQW